jgi:hypothetical protein
MLAHIEHDWCFHNHNNVVPFWKEFDIEQNIRFETSASMSRMITISIDDEGFYWFLLCNLFDSRSWNSSIKSMCSSTKSITKMKLKNTWKRMTTTMLLAAEAYISHHFTLHLSLYTTAQDIGSINQCILYFSILSRCNFFTFFNHNSNNPYMYRGHMESFSFSMSYDINCITWIRFNIWYKPWCILIFYIESISNCAGREFSMCVHLTKLSISFW